VPLLFALWANLHGGVALGLLVLAVTVVCDLVQDRNSPRSAALLLAAPLALAAVCVNPYGIAYWETYERLPSFTYADTTEWAPVWRSTSVMPQLVPTLGVVAALALLAWLFNPRRRWAQLGWLLVLGALFAQSGRIVWPFTLTALMVLAANARALTFASIASAGRRFRGGSVPEPAGAPLRVRLLLDVGLVAWLGLEAAALVLNLRPWRPLMPAALEEGVVRYLREHELPERVFNDYENSGYLRWALAEYRPLYVDRVDSAADPVMRNYQELVRMTPRGHQLLDAQQIDVVVLTTNRGGARSLTALARHLDTDRGTWARVHADQAGVIWLRRAANAELVANLAAGGVSKEDFASLERYGEEDDVLAPAPPRRTSGARR
jgi:hypothetical protein